LTLPKRTTRPPLIRKPVYLIEEQIGFVLRKAHQKHAMQFAEYFAGDLTPTQWSAMVKLAELGSCSQNLLGRLTAMDAATIKGVVDRLLKRGFIASTPSLTDRRRHLLTLTAAGRKIYERKLPVAREVTSATLSRLKPGDRAVLLRLLRQLG
jgi:DNA-binding MarR family transcriptional regulator